MDADCKHIAVEAEESMFRSSSSYQFTPVASCPIHLTRVIEANIHSNVLNTLLEIIRTFAFTDSMANKLIRKEKLPVRIDS